MTIEEVKAMAMELIGELPVIYIHENDFFSKRAIFEPVEIFEIDLERLKPEHEADFARIENTIINALTGSETIGARLRNSCLSDIRRYKRFRPLEEYGSRVRLRINVNIVKD